MRNLYIILGIVVLCNIAVTDATAINVHDQWSEEKNNNTISTVAHHDTITTDVPTTDNSVTDSLTRNTSETKKQTGRYFKEKQQPDSDQNRVKGFITLYKNNIAKHTPDGYAAAYTPWEAAFNACNHRTLDMYMDGIAILGNMVRKDTLEHKYDKLTERRKQIMELYDLAVDNIDDLNSQIDRKRTTDTLSVAKLRVAQCAKYFELWIFDSIFNGNDKLHNTYSKETYNYWRDKLITEDSASLDFMYKLHKDIVFSSDNNIKNPENYYYFSAFFKRYAIKEIKKYQAKDTKESNAYIIKHLKPEYDSIIAHTKNKYSEYMSFRKNIEKDKDILNNINVYEGRISNFLNDIEAGFIGNDAEKLEQYYKKLIAENKGGYNKKLSEEIISRSALSKTEIYFDALRWWYNEEEPSLALAQKIAETAIAIKKYDQAIVWYNKLPTDPLLQFEFETLSKAEKAKIYYLTTICYENHYGKDDKNIIKLEKLSKAIELYPHYVDAYYAMANYIQRVQGLKIKGLEDKICKKLVFYFAYDLYEKALKALKEVNINPEKYNEIKPRKELTEELIAKNMVSVKSQWPSKTDFFNNGKLELIGQSYAPFKKYSINITTRIRTHD